MHKLVGEDLFKVDLHKCSILPTILPLLQLHTFAADHCSLHVVGEAGVGVGTGTVLLGGWGLG
jgi:hypothetical protein